MEPEENKWGVGDRANDPPFATTFLGAHRVELIHGQYKHSYSSNNVYARTPSGTIYEFDGHRTLINFSIESSNYLKSSDLSGDEIRKQVFGKIYANGVQIWEVFGREPEEMLLRLYHDFQKLRSVGEIGGGWLHETERAKLIDRPIWYHDQPATIIRLVEDQGCVIVKTDPSWQPPRSSMQDMGDGNLRSYYDDYKVEDHYEIKTEITSEHIGWWR